MPDASVTRLPTPAGDTATPQQLNQELGVTLDMPFRSWNEEVTNPAEVQIPDLFNRLDAMLRMDGHFRALYRLLTLPFRQAKWTFVANDGGDEEGDFMNQVFSAPPYQGGMSTSFDFIRARMIQAVVYGFAAFEPVWTMANVQGHGNRIVLKKLAPRDARTIRFRATDDGGFDGFVQRAHRPNAGFSQVIIPKEKCFFFTVDKEDHPFYGRSMFEPALYHFDKKHKLYYIGHIAAQFAAVPGRLGFETGAQNTVTVAQRNSMRTALANFGFNSAMMVPAGFDVKPFGGDAASPLEGLLEWVNHHNVQGSQSVLAQFIDLAQGVGGGTGSYALSQDSSDLFLMSQETILNSAAEHINWFLVPNLIDWNFGSGKYPTLKFDPLSDDMKEAMIEVFSALAVAPQDHVTPDFLFELEKRVADRFGLGIDYDKIEEEREEAAKQQASVTDALTALMGQGIGNDTPPPPAPGVPPAPGQPPTAPGATPPPAVAASETDEGGDVIFLADLNDAQKPGRSAADIAKHKRNALGKFAHINEVGQGAGFNSKGQGSLSNVSKDIQGRLLALNIDVGATGVDGKFGPATANAVKTFQHDNGLPETGRVDIGTYALLLEQAPHPVTTDKTHPKPKKVAAAKKTAKTKSGQPSGAKNLEDAENIIAGQAKPPADDSA